LNIPSKIEEVVRNMKKEIGVFDALEVTMKQLGGNGLLLAAGPGNPMTVGWATFGIIWGKPVATVLVRPSRFTFHFMEEEQDFSINVMTDDFAKEVAYCGSHSGRDGDKIEECGLTLTKGNRIEAPFIDESIVHYECRRVHRNNVLNPDLDGGIVRTYYPAGDFHRIYYGEVLGVYRRG
jgi:flavin reductase (DIM6/NTAB) family NADH-FMN oxidoreductase RutF